MSSPSLAPSSEPPPFKRAAGFSPELRRLERLFGQRFTTGNRVRRLKNGDEIFPAMLEAIAGARHEIAFTTFLWGRGEASAAFAAAFAERARAGVAVRVLIDGAGGWPMDTARVEEMRAAGVEVRWFRPLRPWAPFRSMMRTHRKVLVVDGTLGFTGGVGIAWPWQGDARNPEEWRDSHFRLEGPVVVGLEGAFWGNWLETASPGIDAIATRPASVRGGTAAALVVRPQASAGWNDAASVLWGLCETAQRRLALSTPYLAPDASARAALERAAERGVAVDLMIAGPHADKRFSRWASQRAQERLVEAGVSLWEYQPTMLHLKQVLVDDALAAIGSLNLNSRSRFRDDEVVLVAHDAALARTLWADFDQDRAAAKRISKEELARRSAWRRPLAWLLSPVRQDV